MTGYTLSDDNNLTQRKLGGLRICEFLITSSRSCSLFFIYYGWSCSFKHVSTADDPAEVDDRVVMTILVLQQADKSFFCLK